jgi:hypothetical protein
LNGIRLSKLLAPLLLLPLLLLLLLLLALHCYSCAPRYSGA